MDHVYQLILVELLVAVIKCEGKKPIKRYFVVGKGESMTNNVAEYQALIHALIKIKRLCLCSDFIKIKSDSNLLVNEINRLWKVKAPLIVPLHITAKELLTGLHYHVEWIPREKNDEADRLTHLAYEKSLKKNG